MNRTFPRAAARPLSARDLVHRLGRTTATQGDLDQPVLAVASPADAGDGCLAFFRAAGAQALAAALAASRAGIAIVSAAVPADPGRALIVTPDPLAWFIRAVDLLFDLHGGRNAPPQQMISGDVDLGVGVQIGAGTVIERGCRIGDRSAVGPNCYLGPGTIVEHDVFIQNHASLGGVGLGYHMTQDGERLFFPHLGAAVVEREAVVGSGSVVVRGQLDDTVVGARARLGNLVNVGHNVKIGADSVVSSNSSFAGGAVVGARCNIGIGVAVNAKVRIGDDCQVGLGTVVTKSVPAGLSVFGNPARPLPTMDRF